MSDRYGELVPHTPTAPPRQARSIRNDERILDAAVRLADKEGWHGLLIARVAETSALSRRTVSDRVQDRSGLASWVWAQRLAPAVVDALSGLVQAMSPDVASEDTTASSAPVDPRRLGQAMEAFTEPDERMRAAAELLIVATFDPLLHLAVHDTVGTALAQWLTPTPGQVSAADAARRGYVISTALGCLLEARRQEGVRVDLTAEWEQLCATLTARDADRALQQQVPEVHFDHWDGAFDFATGDPAQDRLLEATRDEIGHKGYDAATIDSIVAASGRTKGLLFGRYPSKKQLFHDVTDRYTKGMYDLNEQAWERMLRTMSPAIAEAVLLREFMRPGREHLWVFALEQYRLSWHDPDMREAVAASMAEAIANRMESDPTRTPEQWQATLFVAAAQGIGTMLLGSCYDQAWTLPYQVMTVPLHDD